MVEINISLLYQAVNFLVMLWFLNRFIFRPVLAHLDERDRKMKEMDQEAMRLAKKGEQTLARYNQDLADIRHSSAVIIASARAEAQEKQADILNESKDKFRNMIEAARASIRGEVETAEKVLKTEVARLSESLAVKVLGRKI